MPQIPSKPAPPKAHPKPAPPKPDPAPKPVAAKPKPKPKHKPTVAERFVAELKWGVKHEPKIHYLQVRPIPHHLPDHTLPLTTDCSGFVTLCAQWAGAPDPNGRAFDGDGYTGTILNHCQELLQVGHARPGDLIVYGGGTGHHVVGITRVLGNGDFKVVSHGSERGPWVTTHKYEEAHQPTGVRFLRFLH